MMAKKYLSIFLVSIFLLSFANEADAQRRGKKKKRRPSETEQTTSSSESFFSNEKIAYEVLGTLNFSALAGYQALVLGLKPGASYKILPWLHAGGNIKYQFYFANVPQAPDIQYHDFGVGTFARAVIANQFYAQFEYDFNFFEAQFVEREFLPGAYIGGGYSNGFGRWGYGAQLLFELNEELRDYDNFPLEIWVGFHYNFNSF